MVLTILAVAVAESRLAEALIPVEGWDALATMLTYRWIKRARMRRAVIDVHTVDSLINQLELVLIDDYLFSRSLR